MSKKAVSRNRNKSARHRAKLAAKRTKQRLRQQGKLVKRKSGGRLVR